MTQRPKFILLILHPNLICFTASHPNLQYVVDLAPELTEIITETKYLEQIGLQVPDLARNVALQVKTNLLGYDTDYHYTSIVVINVI